MEDLIGTLRDLGSQVQDAAARAFADAAVRGASEDELVELVDAAAGIIRAAEAVVIEAAGEIDARSAIPAVAERMCTRFGSRTSRDLVQRLTRVSGRRAGEYLAAGRAIHRFASPTTGELLPADFPAMRDAVADAVVGVDGMAAVATVLGPALPADAPREEADVELAASARGGDGGIPTADELRLQAQVWAMFLDQDGAEPREVRADRKRSLTIGQCRDGLVPLRGELLPEGAAQLQLVLDSITNPKLDGPVFTSGDGDGEGGAAVSDPRTSPQKRHDAFVTMLTVAARVGELPLLGGAAPTLVVSTTVEDLAARKGFAHIDGIDEPVPVGVARHVACCGTTETVKQDKRGRLVSIRVSDRVFKAYQRRAIGLRDGTCIIPGCHVPAMWCEIHHDLEAAKGGPTDADNGMLLCWHHHRTIDTGPWQVRMNLGVPEVRAPRLMHAPAEWTPVTTSPIGRRRRQATRMRN